MRGALATLALLATTSIAQADAISGPPDECPYGGEPWGSHSGPICSPAEACTDGSCGGVRSCEAIAYCVVEGGCGGDRPPEDTCVQRSIVGLCGSGDVCPTGSVCFHTRACVTPGSGGCSVSRGGGLAPLLLALIALGALSRRR
jgi:hypothetical protein